MELSERTYDAFGVLDRRDILQANEENIIPQERETIEKLRTWLQPTDFCGETSEFHKHASSHVAGTCDWLLESDTFQQWHGGDQHGMLWLRGKLNYNVRAAD